jgi:tungstate transport system ATP-binding protein
MSGGMGAILPLRVSEASFIAGGRTIIDRVSLELVAGPSTIVLGANGAGKSVLMRLMHGLILPSSGQMAWLGTNAQRARRLQAMVFQRPVMLRRSAIANIDYALTLADVPVHEREPLAREALESVGLSHLAHRPARVLSGGEQQRLALARAWALHPEVLFLDEPTASLDPGATREIESVIRAFDAAGTKIVMATHNLGQARRLGDEVLFIHEGKVAEHSPIEQFFLQPASAEAAAFIKGETAWAQGG